jgi:hypothetical protein
LLSRRVEPEPPKDRARPGFGRPGIDVGKAVLDFADAMRIGSRLSFMKKGGAFCVGRKNGVDERRRGRRNFLRNTTDPRSGRQADLATLKCQLTPDQSEKRCLACAVPTDKTYLMTIGNRG